MSRPDMDLGDTRLIISECEKNGLARNQIAYVLATAFWETAHTMKPVREAYWLSEDWRKKNLRYFPWYGRGYVQLTWERNYVHAGERLGLDLTSEPDVVMQPEISARILVVGSLEGWFTGRKLGDYLTDTKTDFVNARRIINGTDKAKAIALIAREYEAEIGFAGIGPGPDISDRDMPTLRMGNEAPRAAVMMLQQDLSFLGYHTGRKDGLFGQITRRGVMAFQADNGLEADGIVGAQTWAALESAKPAPTREVSEESLRQAKSGTIRDADRAQMVAKAGAATAFGGIGLDTVLDAAGRLSGAESAIEVAQRVLMDNWPVLIVGAVALGAWFYLPSLMASIRDRRVEDARSGAHLGR